MATAPTKQTTKKTATKASKTTKPSKKSTKSAPAETSPPPAPVEEKNVVSETQSVSTVAPESATIESALTEQLTTLYDSIQTMTVLLAKLKGDYKLLEKQVVREARSIDKINAKRKKSKGSRAPSGFVKPTAISKDLAKFLSVAEDTKMARTDVTKLITAYVKDNKLQAPNNGRKILPDKKLMALLNCKASDEVTYFNLQKYMKPHFIKAEPVL
tara:strand:+ start:2296 stop:2937 length:642 start_codon:yes stop_codon:yes gene_type:complete